jgi:hypothetical protein
LAIRLSQTHVSEGVENVSAPPPPRPDAGAPPPSPEHSNGFHGVTGLPPYTYLSFTPSSDPELTAIADEAKRLMSVPREVTDAEVIYGRTPGPGQVGIITRSVLGIMTQLAIEIQVPKEDVARHRTLPTVGQVGVERRPVVIIHSGRNAPTRAFAIVRYGDNQYFWIEEDDFDSKLAFTVLRVLLALARNANSPAAVVTIPAH